MRTYTSSNDKTQQDAENEDDLLIHKSLSNGRAASVDGEFCAVNEAAIFLTG
jgi:hypothetical protein